MSEVCRPCGGAVKKSRSVRKSQVRASIKRRLDKSLKALHSFLEKQKKKSHSRMRKSRKRLSKK